jgi:hypothetical protein
MLSNFKICHGEVLPNNFWAPRMFGVEYSDNHISLCMEYQLHLALAKGL